MEEVEQVNRDSYLQKLEKDFERIRKENLQEVQKWMKNANIDKHEVAKLKENKEQEIKQHNNEMASRLSKLVDTTNEDDEDSTKADPDPTSYSQNASFHSQDSSQSCQNDKSSDSQKPKLRLKESPLKKCIEAIREDEDQKQLDNTIKVIPNKATPGSLLHLCNTSLVHSKGFEGAEVVLYSTNDIKLLQVLYPFSSQLFLHGRADVKEVTPYLLQNTQKFTLVTGWMEHNTPADNDHYIKSKTSYCYLWKLLSPEKK